MVEIKKIKEKHCYCSSCDKPAKYLLSINNQAVVFPSREALCEECAILLSDQVREKIANPFMMSVKKLLKYLFKDINYKFENLTPKEKQCVSYPTFIKIANWAKGK